MRIFDTTIKDILERKLADLEAHFGGDVIFYYGEVHPAVEKIFRDIIEKLREDDPKRDRLVVILNTAGGNVETVEKMVEIIRFHYSEVFFIVPDYAMSAGTIFCMSGNKIYMDYSSSLGPIDPQVYNGKEFVPALGYLDQVERMIEKARQGTLTQAEFLLLQNQDLAMLSRFEQARNLTVTLLKQWLVRYKFSDWTTHQTDQTKKDQPVTEQEKEERAEEIAKILGDNKIWHSHGRHIGISTLQTILRLKIEDYSQDSAMRELIRNYNDLIVEYIARNDGKFFLHSRKYF